MKESKKIIRQSIEDGLTQVVMQFDPTTPSKKIVKLIDGASKKISDQLKIDLRKKAKKESKDQVNPRKKGIRKV